MDRINVLLEHALDVGLEVALGAAVHVQHACADQIDRQRHSWQKWHPDCVGV